MLKKTATTTQNSTRMFLDIPTAASLAGFSIRHFRRIVEDDRIPTMRIRRKFFILASDFHSWKEGRGSARCS
jgi:hypothetical protein